MRAIGLSSVGQAFKVILRVGFAKGLIALDLNLYYAGNADRSVSLGSATTLLPSSSQTATFCDENLRSVLPSFFIKGTGFQADAGAVVAATLDHRRAVSHGADICFYRTGPHRLWFIARLAPCWE